MRSRRDQRCRGRVRVLRAAAVLGALLALPAAASAQQSAPQYDVVAGAGSTSGASTIRVLARTDPSGGDPVGFATFKITFPGSSREFTVSGQVTCVKVTLDRAVLNLRDAVFGIVTLGITDGQGLDPDKLGGLIGTRSATDCSPLSSAEQGREGTVQGNMVVIDAQPRLDRARARNITTDQDGNDVGFSVDARSGPTGEDPTGTVGVAVSLEPFKPGVQQFSGAVRCLRVTGDTAVVGADAINGLKYRIVDGGPGGQDTWAMTTNDPYDCSTFDGTQQTISGGGAVVVDGSPAP